MMSNYDISAASFRDPSGFVFFKNGQLYRQVNQVYRDNFDFFLSSGLYDCLVKDNLLIPHQEVNIDIARTNNAYKIIRPQKIKFISYPYEWCFSQLKDAALTTLEIQKTALKYGMILKDASAYNLQFEHSRPVFIDTLSFEKYDKGKPWVAYRQFCQHFLAPLSLMSYRDVRLGQLLKVYVDGIPLDLAARLLPPKTRFSFSLLTHIHLHAKSQKHYADKQVKVTSHKVSFQGLLGLIDSLETCIKKLKNPSAPTEWGNYYNDTNYTDKSFVSKKELVKTFIVKTNPTRVWDLGANTGEFSRIASDKGILTISFDIDPTAVEKNYYQVKQNRDTNLLPFLLDLTNPSPGIGWENKERDSFIERGPVQLVMALALIHHLAISNNVPLEKIAKFFHSLTSSDLIIEFVPKSDSQVQRLLASRVDIFDQYTRENFESTFRIYFDITDVRPITDSQRTLYLMKKR